MLYNKHAFICTLHGTPTAPCSREFCTTSRAPLNSAFTSIAHHLRRSPPTPMPTGPGVQTLDDRHQASVCSSVSPWSHGPPRNKPPSPDQEPKQSTVEWPMQWQNAHGFSSCSLSSTVASRRPPLPTVSTCRACTWPRTQWRRTKQIELDIHFVREKVALGELRVLQIPSAKQFANIFTKGLPSPLFIDFRNSLCVAKATAETEGGVGNRLQHQLTPAQHQRTRRTPHSPRPRQTRTTPALRASPMLCGPPARSPLDQRISYSVWYVLLDRTLSLYIYKYKFK
jgi:hypothetical protein